MLQDPMAKISKLGESSPQEKISTGIVSRTEADRFTV